MPEGVSKGFVIDKHLALFIVAIAKHPVKGDLIGYISGIYRAYRALIPFCGAGYGNPKLTLNQSRLKGARLSCMLTD